MGICCAEVRPVLVSASLAPHVLGNYFRFFSLSTLHSESMYAVLVADV